jgi:hypothetical protein
VVGSFALGVFAAPPPLAPAVLTTGPAGPATLTVSLMGLAFAPGAMLAAVVHVALDPAPLQLQPAPAAAPNVNPAGSASVTVSVPDVAAVPALLTVIEYVPVEPIVKLPVWVLAIARTGETTAVGSVATGVFVAPPPFALALLVTVADALAATLTVSAIAFALAPAAMTSVLEQVTV